MANQKTKGKIRKSIRKDKFGNELMAKWYTNSHTVNVYLINEYGWEEITCFSIGDFSKNSANEKDWKDFLDTTWDDIVKGNLEI